LLFEWRATDHIRMKDVFSSPSRKDGHGRSKKDAFDYFHINSVDKNDDGDYIVSARYMHAVLCISGKTGETLWQCVSSASSKTPSGFVLIFLERRKITYLAITNSSLS
jgi:hypothetical protein